MARNDQPSSRHSDRQAPVAAGVAYLRTGIVNVVFVGSREGWVLVDAGVPGSGPAIASAAVQLFGHGSRPSAIVLTHGHFDHVGALGTLARAWDVPVFAHEMELPYLTGRSPYPPPDPSVGGGLIASSSWLFPRGPIDLAGRAHALPEDGSVPGMPGWRWLPTPGHSPGHTSFFRNSDRVLIAGDAFVTVKQESALAVLAQAQEIHGPPPTSPLIGGPPGSRSEPCPALARSTPSPATASPSTATCSARA